MFKDLIDGLCKETRHLFEEVGAIHGDPDAKDKGEAVKSAIAKLIFPYLNGYGPRSILISIAQIQADYLDGMVKEIGLEHEGAQWVSIGTRRDDAFFGVALINPLGFTRVIDTLRNMSHRANGASIVADLYVYWCLFGTFKKE